MLKHEDGREGYSLQEKIDLRTHSSGSHLLLSTPIYSVENVYGKLKYSICEPIPMCPRPQWIIYMESVKPQITQEQNEQLSESELLPFWGHSKKKHLTGLLSLGVIV